MKNEGRGKMRTWTFRNDVQWRDLKIIHLYSLNKLSSIGGRSNNQVLTEKTETTFNFASKCENVFIYFFYISLIFHIHQDKKCIREWRGSSTFLTVLLLCRNNTSYLNMLVDTSRRHRRKALQN